MTLFNSSECLDIRQIRRIAISRIYDTFAKQESPKFALNWRDAHNQAPRLEGRLGRLAGRGRGEYAKVAKRDLYAKNLDYAPGFAEFDIRRRPGSKKAQDPEGGGGADFAGRNSENLISRWCA